MASAIAVATLAVQALQEEELTDEKIQILLAQAAERLQEKASSQLVGEDEAKRYTFPKLSTGELARPCVSTKGDVARVENSVALQEKDRKLSNQIRKVEDPVAVRNRQAEVSAVQTPTPCMPMRKTFPNFLLSRVRAPSWLPFCTCESFIIHSYSEALQT